MDPIRDVIARAGKGMLLAGWIRHAVVLLTCAIALAVLGLNLLGDRGLVLLLPGIGLGEGRGCQGEGQCR